MRVGNNNNMKTLGMTREKNQVLNRSQPNKYLNEGGLLRLLTQGSK